MNTAASIARQAGTVPGLAPRRIAALLATNEVSGPGRQLVALGVELKRRGIELAILLLHRPGSGPPAFQAFVEAHGLPCRLMTDRAPVDPLLARDVRRFIADWQPDVVETHSYKTTSIMWALRKLGVRVPWVGVFEGQTDIDGKDRLYTRLDLAMLPAADAIVVMSNLQRDLIAARARNVIVVHNAPPDMTHAGGDTGVALLSQPRGTAAIPLVGVVGRLSPEKGVDVFLDALARLEARGVAATGVIIGDGPERVRLGQLAAALALGDRAQFTGRIEAMAAAYAGLDLLVIPSRSEGLPSTLLEAMQARLPAVSTRVGAMIELEAAYPGAITLVDKESPEALADGIAAGLARRERSDDAAARRQLLADLAIERRADRMLDVYAGTMRARGRA